MPYGMENLINIGSDSSLLSDITLSNEDLSSVASCVIYFCVISQKMTKISPNHQYALEYQTFKTADMYLQVQWVNKSFQEEANTPEA